MLETLGKLFCDMQIVCSIGPDVRCSFIVDLSILIFFSCLPIGGAAGGYTAGSQELVDLLRQRSRPYLFSNALPPPVVACASKVSWTVSDQSILKLCSNGFELGRDESHYPLLQIYIHIYSQYIEIKRNCLDQISHLLE